MGNSASKIPSLQNEYSELAENLQAYSTQKDVKFCKISALKRQSGALYEFFNFSIFFVSFFDRLLNFDAPSSKCSKDDEFKFELIIGLPFTDKPGNR